MYVEMYACIKMNAYNTFIYVHVHSYRHILMSYINILIEHKG